MFSFLLPIILLSFGIGIYVAHSPLYIEIKRMKIFTVNNFIIFFGFIAFCYPFYQSYKDKKIGFIDVLFMLVGVTIMVLSIVHECQIKSENKEVKRVNDSIHIADNIKFLQADSVTRKKVLDSLGITTKSININIDSTRKIVVDSMNQINERTVTILQKTIRDQAKELDSLGRLHAEKHLTNADKKDILRQVNIEMKENNQTIKQVGITMAANSNGAAFSEELITFLKENGYEIGSSGMSTQTNLQGYKIEFFMGEVNISIGVFKL